jgi:hypothetical protein
MYHLCYINTMVLTSTLILAQRVETTGIMFNSILCISIFVLGTQVSHMLEILFRMGFEPNNSKLLAYL